jgi:hypothetical protein
MAGITVAQAQAQLDAYLAAEIQVLAGQSYEIAGRRLTRANLSEIRAGIEAWNDRLNTLSNRAAGRGRAYTVVTN